MADYIINDPSNRVHLYSPLTGYDNVYIHAQDIYVDNIIDVSNGLPGGEGGKGGTAASVISLSGTSIGDRDIGTTTTTISGLDGTPGSGANSGTGGSGGGSHTLGVGASGQSGTDGSAVPQIEYTYAAFSPSRELLNEMKRHIPTGSSGGGGGGGCAGDTFYNNSKQILAAGGGGAGGAGGPAGGRIILLATNTISFGPDSQLITNSQKVGRDGQSGDYIWNESSDNNIVLSRNIQVSSVNGTRGGDGGQASVGIGGSSIGGAGGYGSINDSVIYNNLSRPSKYTLDFASLKKGGDGGVGGIGSGGSIVIQSGRDPSTHPSYSPNLVSMTGTSTTLSGTSSISFKDYEQDTISLTLTPSSRQPYAFFDNIVATVETTVSSWEGPNAICRFDTFNQQDLFSTTEGTPLSSVTLLNYVFTATDAATLDSSPISVLLSSTEGKVGKAFNTSHKDSISGGHYYPNPVTYFNVIPSISSSTCFETEQGLAALYTGNTFAFSGYQDKSNFNWQKLNPSNTSNTSLCFSYESPFVADNNWAYEVGIANGLTQSISGEGILVNLTLTKNIPNTVFYGPEVVDPEDFSEITLQAQADGTLLSTSVSALCSVDTVTFETSAIAYDSLAGLPNLSSYKYDNFVQGNNSAADIININHNSSTINVYISTNEEYQTDLATYISDNTVDNVWELGTTNVYNRPVSINQYIDSNSYTDRDTFYVCGSSEFLNYDEHLDPSTVFYFAVSANQQGPNGTNWSYMSADLSEPAHAPAELPTLSINNISPNYNVVQFTNTRTTRTGTSANNNTNYIGYKSNIFDIPPSDMSTDWDSFINTYSPRFSALTYSNFISSIIEFKYDPEFFNVLEDRKLTIESSGFTSIGFSTSYLAIPLTSTSGVQNISAFLLPELNSIEIFFEYPFQTISSNLSTDKFEYAVELSAVRIPLSGDHGAPIEGWLYDASSSNVFYKTGNLEFSPVYTLDPRDHFYVHLSANSSYNSEVYYVGTELPQVSARFETDLIPKISFSPDIVNNPITLSERESNPSPGTYDIYHNSSTIRVLTGNNTLLAEFSSISSYIDTTTQDLSVIIPANFKLRTNTVDTGVDIQTTYNELITGALSGTYDYIGSNQVDVNIYYPSAVTIDTPNLNAQIPVVTAQEHETFKIDLVDDTSYTPFTSTFEAAYNNNGVYTGYNVLSSVWKATTAHDWYTTEQVNSWASLTDFSLLASFLGELSADFYDNRHRAADLHNVLIKQPKIERGIIKTTDSPFTVQHLVTAIPSGANGVHYEDFQLVIATDSTIELERDYIQTIDISPLIGIYNNNEALTFTYEYSSYNDLATPGLIGLTVELSTYNTNETEVLAVSTGTINELSSLSIELTSNFIDVSHLTVTVSSENADKIVRNYPAKFYAPIEYDTFTLIRTPTTPNGAYLSATPFTYTPSEDSIPKQTKIIQGIENPTPNIFESDVVAQYDFNDGFGMVTVSGSPLSANELLTTTRYYIDNTSLGQDITAKLIYPETNVVIQDDSSLTIPRFYEKPTGSGFSIVTATPGSNLTAINDDLIYREGNISLSAVLSWDLANCIGSFSVKSATDPISAYRVTYNDRVLGLTSKSLSANINVVDYIDIENITDSIVLTPRFSIFPLLTQPNDPAVSRDYLTDYLDSGYGIQSLQEQNIVYVPQEKLGAIDNNIEFKTTIDSVTASRVVFPQLVSYSTAISANIPVDQFNTDSLNIPVSTTIRFINSSSHLHLANLYTIAANVSGTLVQGTTSVDVSFNANNVSTINIPVTATDGFNTYKSQIDYTFNT